MAGLLLRPRAGVTRAPRPGAAPRRVTTPRLVVEPASRPRSRARARAGPALGRVQAASAAPRSQLLHRGEASKRWPGNERRHRGALALVTDASVDFLSLRLNNSTVAPLGERRRASATHACRLCRHMADKPDKRPARTANVPRSRPRPDRRGDALESYGSVGSRDQSPASTRTSSLKYDERITPSQDVAAALGDPRRRRVLDVDDERDAQRAELVEGPARERVEHPGRDAAPARRRRGDVPELDLAPLAVDVDRQREADEASVVVERRRRPRACRRAGPPRSARATGARSRAAAGRAGGEAQDVGIVEQCGDVVEVLCRRAAAARRPPPSDRGAASR